jgi:putative restriction endonuclease
MTDRAVRQAAFEWLAEQTALHGDVLDWSLLGQGFEFQGRRVPLLSQQGIFKPALCDLPLSIRTSATSPYSDHFVGDRLVYSYRGTDQNHRDNVGLRELYRTRTPLVYFHAAVKGRYLTVWPIFIVGDEPAQLRFWAQAETSSLDNAGPITSATLEGASLAAENARREYATREVRQRLHQRGFRERVLQAYKSQCSMCRLRRRDFLDAAHIKPDSHGGEPVVANGLALCKIHHTAFDTGILGVHPSSLRIKVREDVLQEVDGPMLKHGLQAMENQPIWTPRSSAHRPNASMLEWKWRRFEQAV